jgi:hypothetical protein
MGASTPQTKPSLDLASSVGSGPRWGFRLSFKIDLQQFARRDCGHEARSSCGTKPRYRQGDGPGMLRATSSGPAWCLVSPAGPLMPKGRRWLAALLPVGAGCGLTQCSKTPAPLSEPGSQASPIAIGSSTPAWRLADDPELAASLTWLLGIEKGASMALSSECEARILHHYYVDKHRIGTIARQLGIHYGTVEHFLAPFYWGGVRGRGLPAALGG